MLVEIDMTVEVSPSVTMDDMNNRVTNLLKPFYAETYRPAMDPKILTPPALRRRRKSHRGR